MSEARFTGTMVEQHLRYLRETHGDAVVDAALGLLDEDVRTELISALPVSWVRVSSLERFYEALAGQLGRTVEDVHSSTVDHCTRATYGTLWRALLRITTDSAILRRAPVLYGKTYDTGELAARIERPGRAVCEIRGWPGVPDLALRGLRIGIANVLVVAGRRNVRTQSASTANGARFEILWDP